MGKSRKRKRRSKLPKWVPVVGVAAAGLITFGLAAGALNSTPEIPQAGKARDSAYVAPVRDVNPLVAIISDSFTGGSEMGGIGERNWSAITTKQLGLRNCPYSIGGSGWTTGAEGNTFGARVDWAVTMKPSLIIFFNGINDLAADFDAIGPNSNAALADVRAKMPDVPVVVIGPVLVRDEQRPYAERMRDTLADAAATHGAKFIDPIAGGWFNGDGRKYLGADRFHPTDEGHVYMADLISRNLDALGYGELPQKPATEIVECSTPKPAA